MKKVTLFYLAITTFCCFSCNSFKKKDNYLNDKFIKGKITVLHSKEEKYSGLVTVKGPKTSVSYLYDFNVDINCNKLKIDQEVYFKLIEKGGVVSASNITTTKPKEVNVYKELIDTKELVGAIELSRQYFEHIDTNCLTIHEIHTKYHYYKYLGEVIQIGTDTYVSTLWTRVFMGNDELKLYLKQSTYNEIKSLLENSGNFAAGWYITQNNGVISDISLTHNH